MSFTTKELQGTTFRGTDKALLQSFVRRWSPTNGYIEEATYRGINERRMQLLSQYMYRNGFEYEWETAHGVHSLRAVDTSGSVTIDSWEVALNKLSPSTIKNPRNVTNVNAVDMIDLSRFARGEIDYEQCKSLISIGNFPTSLRLLQRISEGSDSFYLSGYVLRHTTNVSNRYRRNVADVGVDMLYDTPVLLSECSNSRFWTYPLPGRLQYKVSQINSDYQGRFPALTAEANYLWSWLKSGSSEITCANNRVNIVTEYEFSRWSTDEYAVY